MESRDKLRGEFTFDSIFSKDSPCATESVVNAGNGDNSRLGTTTKIVSGREGKTFGGGTVIRMDVLIERSSVDNGRKLALVLLLFHQNC